MVAIWILSMSPNVLLNLAKKLFKYATIREFFSNRGENHDKAASESKVSMNLTCAFASRISLRLQ